jgi:hypothetical protein
MNEDINETAIDEFRDLFIIAFNAMVESWKDTGTYEICRECAKKVGGSEITEQDIGFIFGFMKATRSLLSVFAEKNAKGKEAFERELESKEIPLLEEGIDKKVTQLRQSLDQILARHVEHLENS